MQICGSGLTADDLARSSLVAHSDSKFTLEPRARQKMAESRAYLAYRVTAGEVMYGINTGFGAFSSVRISNSQIEELQVNLIRSHCCGVGIPFSIEQSRAMMILRANTLARGTSGVRPEVVETILEFLNSDIIPVIPSQGSVGASGDLAPLAHLALGLIGEGEVWYKGKRQPAKLVLESAGLRPIRLEFKEGLSLINGCQVMTAVGLLALHESRRCLRLMDLASAISLEALRGSRNAFDPLISAERPHPGEIQTATNMRRLLGPSSSIAESHLHCNKVQDAYSLRCIPAVHGAAKDAVEFAVQVLEREANSSTDNPLVFEKDNKVLSCGNFHGEPVSMALDFSGMAMAVAGSISECRIALLINPTMSDLPAFLAKNGGLNSGHMIVQVAAASLVSENKILSHPACVDSIPTSADKEDHVSMGTIAARKFCNILENTSNIVAMEFLSATQALDFLHPLEPSEAVKRAREIIRAEVPFAEADRVFSNDISLVRKIMKMPELLEC